MLFISDVALRSVANRVILHDWVKLVNASFFRTIHIRHQFRTFAKYRPCLWRARNKWTEFYFDLIISNLIVFSGTVVNNLFSTIVIIDGKTGLTFSLHSSILSTYQLKVSPRCEPNNCILPSFSLFISYIIHQKMHVYVFVWKLTYIAEQEAIMQISHIW